MNITTKKVLKYALLPGIIPLLRDLLTTGFSYVSFFMAQIYRTARLLPPGHPYLNPANRGRFGIRNVVATAAGNLKFDRENSDQVIIFFLMLTGLVVLMLQFCFLGFAIFMQTARAGETAATMPTNFSQLFETQQPVNDIAFVMLDRVFGIPDLFNSCVAQNLPCFNTNGLTINPDAQAEGVFPWPFHVALQSMLQFYSVGLLVIAVLIFVYFIIAIVAETAQSGKPFGNRFNHVWAPVRMVVALGLLIPVSNGINAAQYITLYAAKWGSGFATNAWNMFVQTAVTDSTTLAGNQSDLISTPNTPEVTNLLEYNTVLQTCWAAYSKLPGNDARTIHGYLVKGTADTSTRMKITPDLTYDQALQFYNYHDIDVVFGSCQLQNDDGTTSDCDDDGASGKVVDTKFKGGVLPLCGEVTLEVAGAVSDSNDQGSYYIQSQYFNLLKTLWLGSSSSSDVGTTDSNCPAGTSFDLDSVSQMEQWGICEATAWMDGKTATGDNPTVALPEIGDTDYLVNSPTEGYKFQIQTVIQQGVAKEATDSKWQQNLQQLGWGGAAIWYNKIAEMNGTIITSAESLPTVVHYPIIMEDVRQARAKINVGNTGRDSFNPVLSIHKDLELPATDGPYAMKLANTFWQAYSLWSDAYAKPTGNIFVDTIQAMFGVDGLYAMTKNTNVHPLAQLVGLGKSLVESSIRNLGLALGASGIGVVFAGTAAGTAAGTLASIMTTLGMLALGIGFILFYVVPFLPFIYFFFAIGTWVKGVFEAMVGVPLWALAHIRIDGQGLPGDAAAAGYFMILEIFLRPIMIVFGLLASIIIFAAQVRILNDIWSLVTSNLTGFDVTAATAATSTTATDATGSLTNLRDVVDQFFYTVIYAIIVYMLGMSSFKLITQIPSGIMRWLNSVKAFDDGAGDPAQGLIGKIAGAEAVISSGMQQTQGAMGKVGESVAKWRNK